jgi:[ribosomal protein S5]-alanine N-acetyltransferase
MPSFPSLEGRAEDGTAAVRDYCERDIPEVLIAYQDDPQLHVVMGEERPPSGAELGRRAEREPALRAAGTGATLTLVEPGADVCRGGINVHNVDWEHLRAELGIWLAPQARGRGMARGGLRLVSDWLMRECELERVELMTQPHNEPMIRAALGAGFVREGVFRSYERQRGRRVDLVMFSRIKADP